MDKRYSSRPETPGVTLSDEVVRHTLWHFGDQRLGWQPGSFTTHLVNALGASDRENRELLRGGFPEYVKAFELVTYEHWGLDYLRGLAKKVDGDPALQLSVFDIERGA